MLVSILQNIIINLHKPSQSYIGLYRIVQLEPFLLQEILISFVDRLKNSLCYKSNLCALIAATIRMHDQHRFTVLQLHLKSHQIMKTNRKYANGRLTHLFGLYQISQRHGFPRVSRPQNRLRTENHKTNNDEMNDNIKNVEDKEMKQGLTHVHSGQQSPDISLFVNVVRPGLITA